MEIYKNIGVILEFLQIEIFEETILQFKILSNLTGVDIKTIQLQRILIWICI